MAPVLTLTKSDSSTSLQQLTKSSTVAESGAPSSVTMSNPVAQSSAQVNGDAFVPPAPISIKNLVSLVSDAQTLTSKIPDLFSNHASPRLLRLGIENINILRDSLKDSEVCLTSNLPSIGSYITTEISSRCIVHLKSVNDIPRLYRRTNREMPTKPSSYVSMVVQPVVDFTQEHRDVLAEENRRQWVQAMMQTIGEQFLLVTTDVLTSVKKMEESLKRLKAARGTSATGASQGASDDDKIRHQLLLDVKDFCRQIQSLGLKEGDVEAYGRLRELVDSAVNGTLP